ncbi:MAG: hypothetical protein SO120_05165, partial [Prevotella sp.]|nr:hypothetical protein [Prevotella sp.]
SAVITVFCSFTGQQQIKKRSVECAETCPHTPHSSFIEVRICILILLSGKTNNVVINGLKAQQSHSPGQRPG